MSHADYCLGNEGESREFNNKTVDFCSCAIKFVSIQSICGKVKKAAIQVEGNRGFGPFSFAFYLFLHHTFDSCPMANNCDGKQCNKGSTNHVDKIETAADWQAVKIE